VLLRAAGAVLIRPWLWPTAIVVAGRMAEPGWWHRWPPLPVPDRAYLRFRALTAYGDADASPTDRDMVDYLAWCRRMAALRRP
jgi:hypothetical protein